MHTDEYEISVGREIVHCRGVVRKLREKLLKREKKFAMTTEAFLERCEQELVLEDSKSPLPPFTKGGIDFVRSLVCRWGEKASTPFEKEGTDSAGWREDHRDLQIWEQRLCDYEAALRMVKET